MEWESVGCEVCVSRDEGGWSGNQWGGGRVEWE